MRCSLDIRIRAELLCHASPSPAASPDSKSKHQHRPVYDQDGVARLLFIGSVARNQEVHISQLFFHSLTV